MPAAILVLLAIIVACAGCSSTSTAEFEVMSPWADADPIPVRGISPRLDALDGKTIGLYANYKRSAVPQARMVERKLKEKFPTAQFVLYHSTGPNVNEIETENSEKFIAWAKSVDAVIATVGD